MTYFRQILDGVSETITIPVELLDSVLSKEIDEETEWQHLSLSAFATEWDNEEDAIYDNWREIYGVPTR